MPERFRVNPILRAGTLGAWALWLLVTVWVLLEAALRAANIPLGTYISLLFFNFLFGVMTFYYHHRSFVVDSEGIIVLSAISVEMYPWRDVVRIERDAGYLPGYQVFTKRGAFGFLRMEFPEHQRLYALIHDNCGRRSRVSQPAAPDAAAPNATTPEASRPSSARFWHRHGRRRGRHPRQRG